MSYLRRMQASTELSDGQILTLRYWSRVWPATFHDPEESVDSENEYWLEDEPVLESGLPEECTQEFLCHLASQADSIPYERDDY
jgi:hypothetical protein